MASMSMSTSSNHRATDQNADTEDDRSRLRVSKACTRCRTRKDRCDGLKPCTSCRNADKTCTYETSTKKRGLPEGYVRGLEKLTILSCHTIQGLEDVLTSYLKDEEVKKGWNTSAGDELYTNWKDSGVYQQLEEFLQSTTGTSTTGNKRKREDDDDTDSPLSLDTILDRIGEKNYQVSARTHANPGFEEDILPSITNGIYEPLPVSESLPANAKELIDLYFTHVHCWFPVLDRPSVLKAYYGYSKRVPDKRLDGGQALLWAILAYVIKITSDHGAEDQAALSQRYSELALKHIPTPYTNAEDVEDFDIMQAQALIVLSLLRLGNGQWLGAWMCTGRASRILLAKNSRSTKARKGALQGCFIIECLLNVHFENIQPLFPPGLLDEFVDEDGYEEWETWNSTNQGPSFALSIFNRLTRVFLILHKALTEPAASRDPAYVRSNLTSVHNLAQEHFNFGIGSPSTQSPPHHVFFQIGLLFAQLRLVARLSDTESVQFDLTSLATNVLGLFEISEKSVHIGITRVPPLFADILNLAINVATAAKPSFGASATSPTYQDFVVTVSDFRERLTAIWASFRKKDADSEIMFDPVRGRSELDRISAANTLINPYEIEPLGNNSMGPHEDSIEQFDMTPTAAATNSSLQSQWTPHGLADTSIIDSAPLRKIDSRSSWSGFPGNQTFGAGFPVTSPSFAGDEVDAIFHEMAHLDTNEWTNERALGLKDFGFSDESAFMEFCNDPERLGMSVESGNIPLSSNQGSWTFTTQSS